uniref:Uncharacterized protein n=1 Tax=Oryza rufipogon TaxID=4529 RepID=A0A0E0PSC4_ORYRU
MPRKKASSPSPTSTARETRSSSARGHASPTPTPTLRRSTRETTSRFSSSSSSSANKHEGSPAKQSANNNTAKRKMNNAAADTSTRPIKKNKKLNAKSYLALFSTPQQTAKSPPAPGGNSRLYSNFGNVAPPLLVQVDDDNASTVPMQDSGTLLEHEEADTQEQGYQSGLHKVPEVVLEETDVSKNKADEHASTSEAKKTIEAGDPREIKGASTSNQALVTHSDGTDYNEYLCAVCRSRETPGILKFKMRQLRRCHHERLWERSFKKNLYDRMGHTGSIWLCTLCTKKRLQFGLFAVSEGIESLWDVKEVKWKDLGYEYATWELETSSFLCTPEAKDLKRNYESRHEDARRGFDPAKINKGKQCLFQKLQKLPDGFPPGLDKDHLSSLNRLREFWHNSDGAICLDDQERVIKTILFSMSILPDVCQPLLIVSTSASLSLWEAKFNRLAPSINVVVYNGEKDVRKQIQDLEFYENGLVTFQVLLSHPDAILEDIQTMESIVWEAVMVDDCQSLRVSKCLEQLKHLSTNFRMVLLSFPLKESIPEYINLLSFLNPEGSVISSSSNGDFTDTGDILATLKEKFARHVAFERKADSSKFLEYWVPARLSRVQLEMYCYTLLSNSPALRSHSRTDSVGALRDILVSLRKCCDHPYLVDQSLQSSLTKGHSLTDILDIGSGGGAGNPMGDILDDFVRQRFGFESYERVERGLLVPKKQTALNMFNDKTKGRFIFLIDSRACVPSIKLSSVDAIIIYCSDWNPTNDLRVLQRISIESQSECVPIFRLYSSCTVEEKTLILAKHDHILDSNVQNVMPIVSHSLLSWGASFLFNRLEEFQKHDYSSKDSEDDGLFMNNVFLEFAAKLSTNVEASTKMENAVISRAQQSGSFYSRDIAVISEREGISAVDGDLPKFWTFWSNLLGGRSPHWQYISEPVQRNRRKIQNMEDQMRIPAEETDEAIMKRRKIGEIMDSSPKILPVKDNDAVLPENSTASSSHETSVDDTWQELGAESLQGTQKGLHTQLKPELSKLYELLELPETVKCLCEELLDYILKNHQVSQEPKGILHAFNIALCWRAASLLKHKINRRESLALSVRNLNYECDEVLAEYVYEKLRILKKKFSRRASETSKQSQSTPVNNTSSYKQQTSPKLRSDGSICHQVTTIDGDLENVSHEEAPHDILTEEMILEQKELISVLETHREEHVLRDELLERITEKRINLIHMVFSLREKNIQDKQGNETTLLDMHKQKEVAKLQETCNLVVEHLRKGHIDSEDRDATVKLIIEWFTLLLYAFLNHMRCQHNKLKMQQSTSWNKELQLKEIFLQQAKSGHLDRSFDQQIPLPDSCFTLEEFSHFKEIVGNFPVGAATSANCQHSLASTMEIALVRSVSPSEVGNSEAAINGAVEVPVHTEKRPTSEVGLSQNRMDNDSDGIDSQGGPPLAVQHSLSSNPAIDNSNNLESSVASHRSEHLGDIAVEVNADNCGTTLADSPHLEAPTVAALPSQSALPMAMEVDIQTDHVVQSAQQNIVTGRVPQEEEREGSTTVTSAQPLQPEMRPSSPVSGILRERTNPDQRRESRQPEAAPSSVDPTQLFPVASLMFNHPPLGNEPLKNELHRLQVHMDSLNKIYELKKSQLQTECSQEIEKIKQKYDLLIKEQDSAHHQHRKTLDDLYGKVLLNQSLADDFRVKFVSTSAAQARAVSPPLCQTTRQTAGVSQQVPTRPSVAGSIALPVGSSSASRPSLQRHCAQPSHVDRSSSSGGSHSSSPSSQVVRPPPAILGSVVRATSTPFSHTPAARGNYGVGSEVARAPAPHLQFRLPRAHPTAPVNQQQRQLPVRLESTCSRTQLTPVSTPVNARQLSSQSVSPVSNSSSSSSSHPGPALSNPALAANSSSNPVLSAGTVALPPSPHPPESIAAPRGQQKGAPSGLNTVPVVGSGLPPSRSMSDSVSLDAWLTSNLGLKDGETSTPRTRMDSHRTVDVVCLSDDEPEEH